MLPSRALTSDTNPVNHGCAPPTQTKAVAVKAIRSMRRWPGEKSSIWWNKHPDGQDQDIDYSRSHTATPSYVPLKSGRHSRGHPVGTRDADEAQKSYQMHKRSPVLNALLRVPFWAGRRQDITSGFLLLKAQLIFGSKD
jgi:hypothetical protein